MSIGTRTDPAKEAAEQFLAKICNDKDCGAGHPVASNLQHVHTPWGLCHRMIDKLCRETGLEGKDFLVFNLEFVEVLLYDYGVQRERVWFATDCAEKMRLLGHPRYKGVHAEIVDLSRSKEVNYPRLKAGACRCGQRAPGQ